MSDYRPQEKRALCIGGPHHGEFVVAAGFMFRVARPKEHTFAFLSGSPLTLNPEVISVQTGEYKFHQIATPGTIDEREIVDVWIWEGWK